MTDPGRDDLRSRWLDQVAFTLGIKAGPMPSTAGSAALRRRALPDWVAAAPLLVLAALIAWLARWGPDWPAQEFRAWTAQHFGLTAWTNFWYSGEALPGYSVLYPFVSAGLGAPLTGLLAVVTATYGAGAFVPRSSRTLAIAYRLSVGFVLAGDLVIGQVPYLLGVGAGLCALRVIGARGPWWLAAVLAMLSSLGSPLAGAFVLLAVPATFVALGWRRTVPLLGAAVGIVTSTLLDGGGGPFPFGIHGMVSSAAFVAVTLFLTSRADRTVQVLVLTYGLAALGCVIVPNPIGGNVVRFGQLIALPMFWVLLPRLRIQHRRRLVAFVVIGVSAAWPAVPAISSVFKGAADPSRSEAFYSGLLGYLKKQPATTGRLEVVFTREHWEALWVAQKFPIARGWERQTDLDANHALYSPLTAQTYRTWLDDNAVSLVALPNAPIDYGGQAEADLLKNPPSYLVPAWHDANWRVWRVQDAAPLVTGPATLSDLGPASFVLDFHQAGSATVRIRASGMWSVTSGKGCVSATRDHGWLVVSTEGPGTVVVRSRVGVSALGADDVTARCS